MKSVCVFFIMVFSIFSCKNPNPCTREFFIANFQNNEKYFNVLINFYNSQNIVNSKDKNEYIVLQSMQKSAWNQGWGDGTYGKGLFAYRISYPSGKVNVFDYPNNVKGKPRVIPIPADGKILAAANAGGSLNTYVQQLNGDPYPYNGINKIDNFTMYDGTILKWSIYDIVENDAERYVSFKFKNNETTGIQAPSIIERSTPDNRIYTLDGRYVGTDASILPHGIYIQNNKKFVK